ncbi:hypothetical protein BC938DRAFT_475064 [Jimgerdemannia flammicorona]|uniref:Ribosome maturation protein SDO1/SBDS N-terminal domain-containing protein n=1 Tax=Jimgerdemannia flammicorona TaxID=994334 RepID=A0A433QS41_9FUNG|nr:hypothetical protein BC938DRAFT_475064 [Jimgerdemannia flammicorona]
MSKHQLTGAEKAVYKSPTSGKAYIVFIEPGMVCGTIPITDVVQSYDVFDTLNCGSEGQYVRPPTEQLKEDFGTSNIDDIILTILEHGHVQASGLGYTHGEVKDRSANFNPSRGWGVSIGNTGIHG